ncbi:MAG TPA: protein kinase [Gemmatimonadales bacterium]
MNHRFVAALADRYTVERELGQGGMATVYLAHDVKHERQVAIKVLRPELAAVIGAERFVREIRTIANLQHPHILGLIDSGEVSGTAYYVMPFIDGESLRDRLSRETQLPIGDAVRIAVEVADALQYAHSHGVIHRDIKPENILLHGGHALVADFGIALAASKTGGARMTETGMSLGTPQYMSPEQAMGERELDARTDIYALGCTTYEMLTGEPPFTGPTAQAIVAKVMTAEPVEATALRKSIPPHVADAVHTAMQKLPADRFGSAVEFARALAAPVSASRRGVSAAPQRIRTTLVTLAAGVVLGVGVGIAATSARHRPEVLTGNVTHVTIEDGLEIQPAISPDGKMLVYAGGTSMHVRLFLRPTDGGPAVALTADSTTVQQDPRWSPSGKSVLFLANDGVDTAVAGLGGASAVTLINGAAGEIATATWSPDGRRIGFVRHDSLLIYSIANGTTRFAAIELGKECNWSPRGDLIACGAPRDFSRIGSNLGNAGPNQILITPASGGTPIAVTDSASMNGSPVWSPDARRLYFVSNRNHERDIYYVAMRSDGHAHGEPHRLTTALQAASLSISADGHELAYSEYVPRANIWSVPIVAGAVATSAMATQATFGHQLLETMTVTPDGKTLFYDSDRSGNADIWRTIIGVNQPDAITHDPADEFGPVLSPDGKWLAYYSYREGSTHGIILVKPMDGGPTEQVNDSATPGIWPAWSADGATLSWVCPPAYLQRRQCGGAATRDRSGQWHRTAHPPSHQFQSPDGRWTTDRLNGGSTRGYDTLTVYVAGSDQVKARYIRRRPTDPQVQDVRWSPDSRSLYLNSHDADGRAMFWSLPLDGGAPRLVATVDDLSRPAYRTEFAVGGGRIFFGVNDRQSDVFVMELVDK